MTLGSFFDGIGGWQLAARKAGVTPLWSSEIERFPVAVTATHFPDTLQLGDITTINADELVSVDIVCAGSPCQDLSVAGKRAGLNGARSGLFMDAIRIVRQLRERTGKPRYFVWENVPGAFSSNHGLDFRAVLAEISQAEIPMPKGGKWAQAGVVEWGEGSLAWRTLDAQYWGVPQRRKRIFLVADFRGQSAGEILFERESVPRHSSAGREAGEGAAAGTERGSYIPSKARSLTARADGSPCIDRGHAVYCSTTGSFNDTQKEKASTLMARDYKQPHIVNPQNTIRKLTVTECERLQGLPDRYTDIEFNGKPASDSKRYKALGNGMAQPCADYVIMRIVNVGGIDE